MRSSPIDPATPISGEVTPDTSTPPSGAAARQPRARSEAFEAQKRYMDDRFGRGRETAHAGPTKKR